MHPSVEQIVLSDEAARNVVAKAEKEAAQCIDGANEKSTKIIKKQEDKYLQIEQQEIHPIVAEAKQKAEQTLEQADLYIQRLQKNLVTKKTKIIDDCMAILLKNTA